MLSAALLPHINAFLNATSAVFLLAGYFCIRNKLVEAHRACMIAAVSASSLFLISYLIYHAQVGSVRFQGQGWVRPLYFSILLSHTTMAVVLVPMAVITLRNALKQRFDRHRKIARWTFPLWLYVSVTGVIVYFMLYHLVPARL